MTQLERRYQKIRVELSRELECKSDKIKIIKVDGELQRNIEGKELIIFEVNYNKITTIVYSCFAYYPFYNTIGITSLIIMDKDISTDVTFKYEHENALLAKERKKLNKMISEYGALDTRTLKQSQFVDRLLVVEQEKEILMNKVSKYTSL